MTIPLKNLRIKLPLVSHGPGNQSQTARDYRINIVKI